MRSYYLHPILLISLLGVNVCAQSKKEPKQQPFNTFFTTFKEAVQKNQFPTLESMLHYPFYTSRDENKNGMYKPSDPIEINEYAKYSKEIFHADVIRLLPRMHKNELNIIDQKTTDKYEQLLQKQCDAGSILYEAYFQYPLKGSHAESYFGFIFGKIKGRYKVIAYYGKWPVKSFN